LRDIILVVGLASLQKISSEYLLFTWIPIIHLCILSCTNLLWFDIEHHTKSLDDNFGGWRWWGKVLDFSDIILLELLYRTDSCIVDRHDPAQFELTIFLDSISVSLLFVSNFGFCFYSCLNDSNFLLLNVDLNNFLRSLFLGLSKLWHEHNKLLFKNINLNFSIGKLVDTLGVLVDNWTNRFSLFFQQEHESLDQNQIWSWSNIVVSLLIFLIFDSQIGGSHLHINTKRDDTVLLWQVFDIFDEELSNTLQCFSWPG